jgi:hypothetical protein
MLAVAAALALALVVAASAATGYSDPAGDANEAPDIASVSIDEAGAEALAIRVSFANFDVLPSDSRVILRFDLDRNEATGAQGDEATVRYSSDGTLELFRWTGLDLVARPPTGMSATFSDGVFSLTVDRAQLAGASSFAFVAVATRTQRAGIGLVVSTDFAPGTGRNLYAAPGTATFADPDGDHDVAPDITSIEVSDTAAGSILFRLTTANFATLPPDKLIGIGLNIRGRPASDDELFVGYLSGSRSVEVDVEQRGVLQPARGRTGVTASHEEGVMTFSVPRARLDGAAALAFGVVSADLVGPGESEGEEFEGEVEALDTAPDNVAEQRYLYRLTSPGPLRLRAGAVAGAPLAPRAGAAFSARVVVRRLDTYRVVRSGTVTCAAFLGRSRVAASGRFRKGRAECMLQIPADRPARVLRGTITVRSAGASARSSFRYVVR